ncbi:MAG: MiaB/RimO family radical SAM methylthiotransferase [Treponema sp.]|nr:MiaB/RimO family radical SAM methylthiotransferase [Treponema sp.]MCL2237439.1 MiaB/RimO family radical SAM methylthiotransferase [Treponema sp.]
MPSFLLQTLGCKLNQLESEAIAGAFAQAGFEKFQEKNFTAEQPLIIINTCTVTSKADQKARRVIRKALRDYPESNVVVTGCYAQLNKDDILKLEDGGKGRLYVIEKNNIINVIENLSHDTPKSSTLFSLGDLCRTYGSMFPSLREGSFFQFNPKLFSNHTRSFLKIQDGCDKHCTYCKIRLARGKSVSLEADEILSRLRMLEETHAEAVLTGVNICQYKDQGREKNFTTNQHEQELLVPARTEEYDLAKLLDYLLKGTKNIAIRLSSLAPESIDEKLCKVLSHPRIRPHFHLSVQSLNDKILDKMGRVYTCQTVRNAVGLLRGAKNDPFLACDIITGFPGETEKDFNETLNVCKTLDFAWIHVFPFSKREGTPAFLFGDNVAQSEITRRVELFTELARQGKNEYARRWLGKEVDVLIENIKNSTTEDTEYTEEENGRKTGKDFCCGTSDNYLKVLVKCEEEAHAAGTQVKCRLKEGNAKDFDATGDFISVLRRDSAHR